MWYPPDLKTKDEKIEYLEKKAEDQSILLDKRKYNPYETTHSVVVGIILIIVLIALPVTYSHYSDSAKTASCEADSYKTELEELKTSIDLALTNSDYSDIVADVRDIDISTTYPSCATQ